MLGFSAVAAQLCPPQNADRGPLMVIYIKSQKNVMLRLEAVWPSKQNILIADTIFAEPDP